MTQSSPFKVARFWSVAGPGKTLCLLDGTYQDAESMITPPQNLRGMAGSPITVRALNDGRVLIDGQSVRRPVFLYYNDYFVIEGINARNSSESVVRLVSSSHNVVRRVAAWDAADGNTEVMSTSYSEDTLFEDVAAWGVARKIFGGAQGGNRLTCRRCWGRWEGSHVVGPKMTYTLNYNNYGMLVENSIGTWSGEQMKSTYTLLDYAGNPWTGNGAGTYTNYAVNQPYGIFSAEGFDNAAALGGTRLLGSLAYVTAQDRFAAGTAYQASHSDGVEFANSVAYLEPGAFPTKAALALSNNPLQGTSLVVRSMIGVAESPSAIGSQWQASNVAQGPTPLSVPNPYEAGQLCTRYKDGVLTSEPLWPWPMNQRILDAMVQSGRALVDVTKTVESMFGVIPAACRQ